MVLQKFLGKSENWKVLNEKWKKNLKVKSEKQKWKKVLKSWKLKAKCLILKTASEKQKRKFYDFVFQLCYPLRGWVQEPQDQQKSDIRNQRWKHCWPHSMIRKACFITNSFQDSRSLLQFIWQLWNAWYATFIESGPSTANWAVGDCCMTTCQHKLQFFWQAATTFEKTLISYRQ